MRISIDCRCVRERPSGIGVYLEEIIQRIPEAAADNTFLLWKHRLAPPSRNGAPNVTEITVPVEPNSYWTLAWPQRYASFEDVDVFHAAHSILPKNIPCRTVVTLHDVGAIDFPELEFTHWGDALKRWYYPLALWRALREGNRLIVTTTWMADRVMQLCPTARGRIVVVPLAADAVFQPSTNMDTTRRLTTELIGSPAPYFLVVGQNRPNKRHWLAVEAFARAVPEPWRLVLVRQTRDDSLANLSRRLGIADRVTFLPQMARENLLALYQGATALIQPSIYEGFGLPVLEAMACGCPVIVSDIPALREVVEKSGILVPPNNTRQFGESMALLAKSAERRSERAEAGKNRAKAFSWDRCARETIEVYHEAAR